MNEHQVQAAGGPPIIEIRGLGKRYYMGRHARPTRRFRLPWRQAAPGEEADNFWALKGIDLAVYEGERVGIIGRNGAGKSTLLKILSRVVYPTEGEARIRGRVTSLLEVGTGFNNNATGRENIYINASLHGLHRREIDAQLDAIIAFAELRNFIDMPIKHYSSGMRSRLAFAVAAHIDPDILILDEVLSVGDIAFQQKCLVRMNEVTGSGRTLLFVSHSLASITQFCNRCIWLDNGRILMDGPAQEVTENFSSRLLGSVAQVKFEPPPRSAATAAPALDATGELEPWAHLLAVTASAKSCEPRVIFAADEEIVLEAEFEVTDDRKVLPAFRVYQDNLLVFTMAFWTQDAPDSKGLYRAQARIPPFLLGPGEFEVSAGLNTPFPGRLMRHHVVERALRFSVRDVTTALSPRGPYPAVKGAVRPLFEWTVERLG